MRIVGIVFTAALATSPLTLWAHSLVQHHSHRGLITTRPLLQQPLVTQNNAMSPVSSFDWRTRIHFSGYLNVDAKYGTRGLLGIVPQFSMSDDAHDLNVNNANLFFDARINPCVNTHVGFAYVADGVNLFDTGLHTLAGFRPVTKSLRADKASVFAGGELSVDEAYISIQDFAQTPAYLRVGKMYVPFGSYRNPYPISYSLTQLLSQTRATTAEVGFVSSYGIYGSAYILDGGQSSANFADEKFDEVKDFDDELWEENGGGYLSSHHIDVHIPYSRINNYGLKAGWHGCWHNANIQLATSYIKDIRDVSYLMDIQDLLALSFARKHNLVGPNGFAMVSAGGVSAHGDVGFRNLELAVNFVSAIRNIIRKQPHHLANLLLNNNVQNNEHQSYTSTRLWAADISGVYHGQYLGYNTSMEMSYQFSGQANGVLPKWRYQGDISVDLSRNTTLTLEYRHDRDYQRTFDDGFCGFVNATCSGGSEESDGQVCGGTGKSANQATLRLAAQF